MPKPPKRRRGRVPEGEKRVYVIALGRREDETVWDLVFYLNRQLDTVLPIVRYHTEVERVMDMEEAAIETALYRFRHLGPEAMRRMIRVIIEDALPESVHPRWYR